MSTNTKYLNNKKYTYEYFTQENVCRLCWKTTDDAKSITNDAELAQNIEEHISVNVTKHILQSICCDCAEKVESFSQFYKFCHVADLKLERILETGSNMKKIFHNNYHDPSVVGKEADLELKRLKKVPKLKKEQMSYNLKDFQVNSDDEFLPNEESYCYTCILNLESAEQKKKHDAKVHKLKQMAMQDCCFCNKKFTKFSQKIVHEMQCEVISKLEKNISVPKRTMVKVKKETKKKLILHTSSPLSSPLRSPMGSPPIPQKNEISKPKPKVIACQLCPETFKTYREYNRHRFVHRRNVKCICEICGNKYPKDALARHMRIHTGHKVKCPHCNFSGHFSENVRAHIRRVHLRERRFACHICPLRCFTKHNLNVHIKTHFGVKDFKCELCPKRYSMKIALQQHIKLVHEGLVGQYKCTYCTSRYNKVESLRKHMLKGHGKRIRACKGSFYEVDDNKNGVNQEANQQDPIITQGSESSGLGYVNNNV